MFVDDNGTKAAQPGGPDGCQGSEGYGRRAHRRTIPMKAPRHDQDLYQSLGELVATASIVEYSLRMAIRMPVQDADRKCHVVVHVLTAGLSFRDLVAKFGALHQELYPERKLEVQALCTVLTGLNDKRNTFVHSEWWVQHLVAPIRTRTTTRQNGLVQQVEQVDPDRVSDLVRQFSEADDQLHAFVRSLHAAPPTASPGEAG